MFEGRANFTTTYAWLSNYDSASVFWTLQSIGQEETSLEFIMTHFVCFFFYQSSFINQHITTTILTKTTYLDTLLVSTNLNYNNSLKTLYMGFTEDLSTQTVTYFLPFNFLLQCEYQDPLSVVLLLTPELTLMMNEYLYDYSTAANFIVNIVSVLDSYTSNTGFSFDLNPLYFVFFALFVWTFIYFICSTTILSWVTTNQNQFVRLYYYFFTLSREIRIQLEATFQTILFFILYWGAVLMTFDDNQEEIISFIDGSCFYLFVLLTVYIIWRYSIHYFAFIEASVVDGRSVSFLFKQCFKDFLNSLSLILRFYILLLRINVYDTLDDFLDSYYIFVGDFDEDEYLGELFTSLYDSFLHLQENDCDTSYLMVDEHSLSSDLLNTYFIVWGKLFYLMFFIVEEAARLSLAFYVCYLIVYEVHLVNVSYREDLFLYKKRV